MKHLFPLLLVLVSLFVAVSVVPQALAAPAAPAMVLSGRQVAQIAYNAGFRGYELDVAVGVAHAESYWNPGATGYNSNGTYDRGLMQLNSYWQRNVSNACAYNAQCNMNYAFRLAGGNSGSGWHLWTTYRTGAYRAGMYQNWAAEVGGVSAAPAPRPAPAAAPLLRRGRFYRVVRGDTLSKIARGDRTSWQRVFAINRGIIRNPNLIFPGELLRLP